jgi:hypothetical protein
VMPGRTASGCRFPKPCHGPVDRIDCPGGPPVQAALDPQVSLVPRICPLTPADVSATPHHFAVGGRGAGVLLGASFVHQAHKTGMAYRRHLNKLGGSHPPASQGGVAEHVRLHTHCLLEGPI